MPILNEQYDTIGYVIGSYKGYYPITNHKNKMYCGKFSFNQLAGLRIAGPLEAINYKNYTWTYVEDFMSDTENNLHLTDNFCFVYL